MASRIKVAGIGRQHIKFMSNLKLSVVGGGTNPNEGTVYCHPDDLEAAKAAFHPSLLDTSLDIDMTEAMKNRDKIQALQGGVPRPPTVRTGDGSG